MKGALFERFRHWALGMDIPYARLSTSGKFARILWVSFRRYAADQARGELYVAQDEGGTILGAVCLNQEQAPEYAPLPWAVPGPAVVLHRLAVDPAAQRRGVGRSFFQFGEAMARRLGLPVFHLDTYARNDRMQALIRSQGFAQVGTVHFDREGRPDGFPCFEKVL